MLISLASFVLASFLGTKAFEWKSPATEGDIHVYTCNGSVVTFPWDFNMDNDTESLINIMWFEQGNVVALYAAGHFFSDNSNVEHVPLAGLRVNGVKVGDTYTVTVDVQNSSGLASYTRTGHVDSVEPPELVNGHLELELEPSVTMDEATGQWFVELRCGYFVSLGHPPVTVRWMTPSGQEMNSSGYHHGSFVLNLPPVHVDTGDYTCSLDNTDTDQALDCLPPLHAQRSLYVDGKEVLVKVLEEEKGVLQDWVNRMADLLQQSQAEITDLRRNGSDLEAQLKTCLMLNTTSFPATTTKPTTGTQVSMASTTSLPTATTTTATTTTPISTKTTQEMGTCEDAADNCSWFNIWKCTDPTEGPHYRTVCRKTCGLCHDVSMASTTSLPTATTTTATTTPISTKTTRDMGTCEDAADNCSWFNIWKCTDPTEGPHYSTVCRNTCGLCHDGESHRPHCRDRHSYCMYISTFDCNDYVAGPDFQEDCPKTCGQCPREHTADLPLIG